MANNFVMRKAGSSDPWSQSIPSDGGTLSGSASFEVKPTANNEATFDLTGRLEVTLSNSSKKLVCNLRQKGHRQEDEDPGKQYHFHFRGLADNDQSIFVGIECDGRLLQEINATNQDIADYQHKTGTGLISRDTTFYVDIFSYYLQGTKDSTGRYIFNDTAENRIQVPITISNLSEWLQLDRLVEVTGITDGGVSNCICYRATFKCEPLTNYNTDGDQDPQDPDWLTRFPLDISDGNYRGVPRYSSVRIQPQFGNQKEINFKEYGGYRRNLIFGKQLELSESELIQAEYGYYELIADNTGAMHRYNQHTLSQLPKVDLGRLSWQALNPTIDFIFKLGTNPTSTPWSSPGNVNYFEYIGYPIVISGLHIINTLDYGDCKYDTLHISKFRDLINGLITGSSWMYKQSDVILDKLAISGDPSVYFCLDVISLNDLHSMGYISVPTKLTGDSHTSRSPIDQSNTIPYINILNIINQKRSLTNKECEGYRTWISDILIPAWKQKLHTTSSNTDLADTLLGDSASTYLIFPRISVHAVNGSSDGYIGSNGNARLNEWIPVEDAVSANSEPNASIASCSLTWGPDFPSDSTNVFDLTYDELVQFRFKLID